jgi:hypothetical protein
VIDDDPLRLLARHRPSIAPSRMTRKSRITAAGRPRDAEKR